MQHIQTAGVLHANCPRESGNINRNWDQKTPFVSHPIWCACTIITEQKLSEERRHNGALVLLYHDIIEDTMGNLPPNLPEEVMLDIKRMTHHQGSSQWEDIKHKPKRVRLYKLYDKTHNFLDPLHLTENTRQCRVNTLQYLLEDVRSNFGELNITRIAASMLACQ
ncbi:hypothetical protein GF391_02395 [Candidatus Uhrbacteria bacterium]|nr:hypothetical protein [Candidatus Uhrbacteria bacterium]